MPRKPVGYWTYERCLAIAKPYTKIVEWAKCPKGRASYLAAYRKRWHRVIGTELGWTFRTVERSYVKRPAYEKVIEETVIYKGVDHFRRSDRSLFLYCENKGWLDNIVKAQGWDRCVGVKRTYEDCKELASFSDGLTAWKLADSKSYRYATKRGWQVKISEELGWPIAPQSKRGKLNGLCNPKPSIDVPDPFGVS